MSESPIDALLTAIDSLDVERALALMTPEARFLAADGRLGEGQDGVRAVLISFLGALRSTTHRITAQWHVEDEVWIAEAQASYELKDYLEINALARVFVARTRGELIADLRVYGAHEHPLTDHRTGEEGMWVGGRLIPPL